MRGFGSDLGNVWSQIHPPCVYENTFHYGVALGASGKLGNVHLESPGYLQKRIKRWVCLHALNLSQPYAYFTLSSARNELSAVFGIATAPHYLGPYTRLNDGERIVIEGAENQSVEDACVWQANGYYHMVAKIFKKRLTGEYGAGFYAYSKDGIKWSLTEHPKAYSRSVLFSDGKTRKQKKLERPQVLVQGGKPTHIFFAADDPEQENIYNLVIPLKRNTSEK